MSEGQIWSLVDLLYKSISGNRDRALPVAVRSIVSLKDSPSITCAPELGPDGDRRDVIAWIPCRVPARTKYSFDVSWARPSGMHV
jgi:hypothetical protein